MKPAFQIERDVWVGGAPAGQMQGDGAVSPAASVGRPAERINRGAIRVEAVMTRAVITADPMFTAARALALADRHGVSHLPVAWSDRELLGIVCVCELWLATEHQLITHLMSLPVITIEGSEPLSRAAELMRTHDVGSLPVVDAEQRLVGIITLGDLVRAKAVSVAELPPACTACHSRHHVRTGVPIRTARSSSTFCVRCLNAACAAVAQALGSA
jgi:CBS domain-containing protein